MSHLVCTLPVMQLLLLEFFWLGLQGLFRCKPFAFQVKLKHSCSQLASCSAAFSNSFKRLRGLGVSLQEQVGFAACTGFRPAAGSALPQSRN